MADMEGGKWGTPGENLGILQGGRLILTYAKYNHAKEIFHILCNEAKRNLTSVELYQEFSQEL